MINFHKRTFVKGLTWECSGLIALFLASVTILSNASVTILSNALTASIFTILYTALRVGMFYLHERIWKKTTWGKTSLDEKKDD